MVKAPSGVRPGFPGFRYEFRGSIYTTIMELGPQNHSGDGPLRAYFQNSSVFGPSGEFPPKDVRFVRFGVDALQPSKARWTPCAAMP